MSMAPDSSADKPVQVVLHLQPRMHALRACGAHRSKSGRRWPCGSGEVRVQLAGRHALCTRMSGIDTVPAVVVNGDIIRFEDYDGDTGKLDTLLRQKIDTAKNCPLRLTRNVSRSRGWRDSHDLRLEPRAGDPKSPAERRGMRGRKPHFRRPVVERGCLPGTEQRIIYHDEGQWQRQDAAAADARLRG